MDATEGTYLAWLDCRALGLGEDPAAAFLERGRIALGSGPRYGSAGFVRLNFATSPELLREGVRRMAAALPTWLDRGRRERDRSRGRGAGLQEGRQVDDDRDAAVVGGLVDVGGLLDQPLTGLDAGGLAGLDPAHQPWVWSDSPSRTTAEPWRTV